MTRVELCRLAGLDPSKKIVLYAPASNMYNSAVPIIWTRIRELASTDTYLLIKLDSDACQEYKLAHRRIAEENRNIRYIDDIDITPYLHLADVMVADVSEAFLEFALLDKPVVLFNNPNRREDPDYSPEDAVYAWRDIGIQVTTFSGIKTAVTRCFEKPDELSENRRCYSEKMGIRLDGNSSGRVVEQMWRLLDGGKATHQGRTESVSEDIHADSDVDKTTRARIHELVMEIGTIMPNETDCEAEKALKLTPDHPMASKILRGPNRRAPVIKATRTNGRGAETRILFIAHNFPPISFAGSELYMLNLSQALQELGAEVQVVHPCSTSPDGSSWAGFKVYDGVPVHRLPLPFVRGELFLTNDELTRQLTEVVSGYKPDIIHVQHLIGWPSNLLQFLSEFSKPVLLTLHDFYMMCLRIHLLKPDHRTICSGPRTVETCDECISSVTTHNEIKDWDHVHRFLSAHLGLYKEGYRGIDRVLAPSQYLMDIYEDNGFYNPETFHWQFGLKLFNRLAKTEPDNKVRFTYIGNLTRLKGIMDLVNAFRAISPMDAELSVWGQEFPRHLEEEFHSIADPLTHVHLKGRYTPDALPRILADGDVVVVPSHIENYPLVVREALHAGLPVIASRVGGIPEIVDDNVNGILFRPGDVQDLTAKLQSVIDRPNLLSDLAANIKPVRSIENDAQAHMNLYRGLLTEMTDKDHVEEIIESARGLALRGLSRVATKRIERALQDNPNESRLRECLAQLSQTQVV